MTANQLQQDYIKARTKFKRYLYINSRYQAVVTYDGVHETDKGEKYHNFIVIKILWEKHPKEAETIISFGLFDEQLLTTIQPVNDLILTIDDI